MRSNFCDLDILALAYLALVQPYEMIDPNDGGLGHQFAKVFLIWCFEQPFEYRCCLLRASSNNFGTLLRQWHPSNSPSATCDYEFATTIRSLSIQSSAK